MRGRIPHSMRKQRITITLNPQIIKKIDQIIDHKNILNRSHAIEVILKNYFKTSVETAIILAGGKKVKKTPLFKLNGITLFEYQIEQLVKANIKEIILITNDDKSLYDELLKNMHINGSTVTVIKEPAPTGTAGTINTLRKHLKDKSFLVLHGDVYTELNFENLIEYHTNQNYTGTMVLTTVNEPQKYGMATVQGIEIVNFKEKPRKNTESNLISAGIYVLNSDVFDYIENHKPQSMENDVFPKLARENKLASYIYQGEWADISYADMYERVKGRYSNNKH